MTTHTSCSGNLGKKKKNQHKYLQKNQKETLQVQGINIV